MYVDDDSEEALAFSEEACRWGALSLISDGSKLDLFLNIEQQNGA